jgi:pimeloyl-ACP methyl ester carboxylesterase
MTHGCPFPMVVYQALALSVPVLAGGPGIAPAQQRADRGLVVVVDGVGGFNLLGNAAQWALPRAGVDLEVREFSWTHGKGQVLRDLQDYRYTQQKARELAEEIQSYRDAHPGRPVYLVGKSGGAGLVLGAAGQLSEPALERIVLLSPAVSHDYDLRPALRAVKQQIVVYYSPYDRFVLSWGTKHFGTIDRYYEPGAGLDGFLVPQNLSMEDAHLYGRLIQVRWNPRMIREGNLGGHLGTSMPGFIGHEVGRWLRP